MSYNGGDRGDIARGAIGAGGETRQSLHGPSAGKAIAGGFAAIHSQPSIIIFFLIFTCVLSLSYLSSRVVTGGSLIIILTALGAGLCNVLVSIFLQAGFMGSIELILLQKGWRLAAVLECGKLYFSRFLAITLLIIGIFILLWIPFVIAGSFLKTIFDEEGMKTLYFLGTSIIGLTTMLLLNFAYSSAVIDNLRSTSAINRGFRIALANKQESFLILLMLCVPILVISKTLFYFFGASWIGLIVQRAVSGYILLILMATGLYFVLEIRNKEKEQLCEGVTTG